MDVKYLSNRITLILEGDENITFSTNCFVHSDEPTPIQCRKKVIGLKLNFMSCVKHCTEKLPILLDFEAENGIIKNTPENLKLFHRNGVYVLKYGTTRITPAFYTLVHEHKFVGYWDSSNIIIGASNSRYFSFIDSIYNDLLQPGKGVFNTDTINLEILSVDAIKDR